MKNFIIFLMISYASILAQGLTIGSGTTLNGGSSTITVGGNWINSGTFTAGSSTVVFNGSNSHQTITNSSDETFSNLTVNKSAYDVQLVNHITVNGVLEVNNGDLDLNGNTCYLGASAELFDGDGNTVKGTSGTITATRTLNAPTLNNIAGLGAVITSTADLGVTVVTRGHAAQSGGGNVGILRYYDISPANNSGLNATLGICYDESELNGITESELSLYSSADGGTSWTNRGGICGTSDNIIELQGIDAFSRWTAGGSSGPLPVELTSFTVAQLEAAVLLEWETATEVNNYGFEIERQQSENGTQNTEWKTIGFVEGHGNSNSPKSYEFIDAGPFGENPPVGDLQYRLKQIDTDGTYEYYSLTAEVDATITSLNDEQLPEQFHLSQNYPNPFNPTTTIKYNIPVDALSLPDGLPNSVGQTGPVEGQHVLLKIYDILGNEVSQLVNKFQPPGFYEVEFDGRNLASGVYFYRLTSGKFTAIKKMVLMR